jgi:hypothetical protein
MLKPSELCDVLKACHDAKVRELKFKGLHVIFAPAEMGSAIQGDLTTEVTTALGAVKLLEREANEKDELALREEQLALMRIENPAEYEAMLSAGELDDGEGQRHFRTE